MLLQVAKETMAFLEAAKSHIISRIGLERNVTPFTNP